MLYEFAMSSNVLNVNIMNLPFYVNIVVTSKGSEDDREDTS